LAATGLLGPFWESFSVGDFGTFTGIIGCPRDQTITKAIMNKFQSSSCGSGEVSALCLISNSHYFYENITTGNSLSYLLK
jgi:hypothetical protein